MGHSVEIYFNVNGVITDDLSIPEVSPITPYRMTQLNSFIDSFLHVGDKALRHL